MKEHGGGGNKDAIWGALDQAGMLWTADSSNEWLLAIDDTDNLTSRGTGFRARELALRLAQERLATVKGITRHQLLVDPRIPYTSHNSSACLALVGVRDPHAIFSFGCEYLLQESAEGSDAGIVLLNKSGLPPDVVEWGKAAKTTVLEQHDAKALAKHFGIQMAGLTGTGGGVIGALAATGLHCSGNDGRFLWVRHLRGKAQQHLTVQELSDLTGVTVLPVSEVNGSGSKTNIEMQDLVDMGEWPRAILFNAKPVLLVEKINEPTYHGWRVVPRDVIQRY